MSTSESALDAEELMHLALRAMDADNNEEAITYLKRALVLAPNEGRLHFLLGAVHAEIGLDERAIAELTRAAQLAPELHTAHFQLGTLLLKHGEVDRAMEAWRPLDVLDRNHPLYLFKSALTRLAEGDYAQCIAELKQGIARNDENEFLNVEMREVLARTEALLAAEKPNPRPAPQRQPSARKRTRITCCWRATSSRPTRAGRRTHGGIPASVVRVPPWGATGRMGRARPQRFSTSCAASLVTDSGASGSSRLIGTSSAAGRHTPYRLAREGIAGCPVQCRHAAQADLVQRVERSEVDRTIDLEAAVDAGRGACGVVLPDGRTIARAERQFAAEYAEQRLADSAGRPLRPIRDLGRPGQPVLRSGSSARAACPAAPSSRVSTRPPLSPAPIIVSGRTSGSSLPSTMSLTMRPSGRPAPARTMPTFSSSRVTGSSLLPIARTAVAAFCAAPLATLATAPPTLWKPVDDLVAELRDRALAATLPNARRRGGDHAGRPCHAPDDQAAELADRHRGQQCAKRQQPHRAVLARGVAAERGQRTRPRAPPP